MPIRQRTESVAPTSGWCNHKGPELPGLMKNHWNGPERQTAAEKAQHVLEYVRRESDVRIAATNSATNTNAANPNTGSASRKRTK